MTKSAAAKAKIPVRRKVRELKSQAYREAILEAAEQVFLRVGFRDAKMSELAEAAGVSTGTLYNYFDNKEAVYASLVEEAHLEMLGTVNHVAESVLEPLPRIHALVRALLERIEERGALFALFMQMGAVTETDIRSVCGVEMEQGYLYYLGLLTGALDQAVARGEIRSDVPTHLLCSALAGAVNGATFAWVHGGQPPGFADEAQQIVALFLEGASPR
jgi:AcrR family transcriptional regulator